MSKTKKKDVALHEKFDLADITPETRLLYAMHLEQMLITPGWQLMKQILESNLNVLERAIVMKRDPQSGATLNEAQADELRMQHAQIEQLLRKPADIIERFKMEKTIGDTGTYDPYQRSTDMREERKLTSASTLE